jgi:2-polyprenyl-3-methyl-5-hydroxy-6-metoxy-1,4-benzoquinol methylase
MSSPWLSLPLADYEGHMSAPNVGQADLLAGVFANALKEFRPASVAVIGCAGGNGFDRIDPLEVTRVVGVDINAAYLEIASSRYSGRFRDLELRCSDIAQVHLEIEPVELVYAALVFEYVDVPSALRNLCLACLHGGHLVTLLQLPSNGVATVTPTAFTNIQTLSAALKLVDPLAFEKVAQNTGFALRHATRVTSGAGKEFAVHVFQRSSANTSLERTRER